MGTPLQKPISIPEPTDETQALWASVKAIKECVEVMQGISGNREYALKDDLVAEINELQVQIGDLAAGGGGASELSDLTDVNTSTPTNRFALMADGVDFESRLLVEADISDLAHTVGVQGLGIWRYRTEITTPPASGQIRFNNANVSVATEFYLHETTDGGTDVAAFLELMLQDGSVLYMQDQTNASNHVLIEISSSVDSGTYRTYGIQAVSEAGTEPAQNTSVILFTSGVAAAGGNVTKVGTPVNDQIGVWTGDGTIEGIAGFTFDGTTFAIDTAFSIFDTSGADSATFLHNGANFTHAYAGTTYVTHELDGTTGGYAWMETGAFKVWIDNTSNIFDIRDGYLLRVRDSGDTNWVQFSHDSTDFNIAATNTTALNITGVQDILIAKAQTGNLQLSVNNTGVGTGDNARFSMTGNDTGFAIFVAGSNHTGTHITGGPTGEKCTMRMLGADPISFGTNNIERMRILGDGTTQVRSGNELRCYSPNNAEYVSISHSTSGNTIIGNENGGTENLRIENFDTFQIKDGCTFSITNADESDSMATSLDDTDVNTVFTGVNDWNLTGLNSGVDFDDKRVKHSEIEDYTVTHQTLTEGVTNNETDFDFNIGNSASLNLGDPDFDGTPITLTVSGVRAEHMEFTLIVEQHSSTRAITWPATFDWPGGTAPTLTTGDGSKDIIQGYTVDSGTTWYCTFVQDFQ